MPWVGWVRMGRPWWPVLAVGVVIGGGIRRPLSDNCPKRVRRPPKHHYQSIRMAPPLSWSRPVVPLNPLHAWEAQGGAGRRIDTRGVWYIDTLKGPTLYQE